MELNRPIENPRLRELFEQRRTAADQKQYNAVMNLIAEEIVMKASFLTMVELSEKVKIDSEGKPTFNKGTTIDFIKLADEEGVTYYPAFMDMQELNKWPGINAEEISTVVLSFDDLAAMVASPDGADGIVINPCGEELVIEKDLIAHWCSMKKQDDKNFSEITVKKETSVILSDPEEDPAALKNALRSHAEKDSGISRMWLRVMERSEDTSWLLTVDFEGDREKTFRGLAAAANNHLDGMFLDMVPFSYDFGRDSTENCEPFYIRK